MSEISNFTNTYRDEASDLLADLEIALLELESTPDDNSLISRVFRNLHTIKGSGAMFGFEKIASFTHELETAYDAVRDGKMVVTPQLISLTLLARDHIKKLLDGIDSEELQRARKQIVASLAEIQNPASMSGSSVPAPPKENDWFEQNSKTTYGIRFKPPVDIFKRAFNLLRLFREIRALGECSIVCHTGTLPDLDDFEADSCYAFWDLEVTTTKSQEAILDVFEFVDDDLELKILSSEEPETPPMPAPEEKPAAPVIAPPAERPVEIGEAVKADIAAPKPAAAKTEARSLRVSAERLDGLVNIVGEIVTLQARLTQVAFNLGEPEIAYVSEEMERLTDKLRDNTMSIRMLPIGPTFANCRRLVRDLGRDLGKEVDLITEGGDTELDKTVIDRISDPLVHLIRNCVDHGVEMPDVREAAGKPRGGKIVLSATHSGAHVIIQITDDGAGLNKAAILRKALERGLIKKDQDLMEHEIFALILNPGFSTAKTLSDVSGRGVGMDVVKQNVEALKGTLEIASKEGLGSVFTLKLPLTLAIIDGLLVRVADRNFVLPLANILECVELTAEGIRSNGDRKFVVLRNEMVPYVELREHYDVEGQRPEISQVMIAETSEGKFGFLVDNVVGDHKTVIKRLTGFCKNVESISGATILGDGTVALILDLNQLAKCAVIEHRKRELVLA